ncbi:MAG: sigma factor [Johnsonella sp.]|nr:sigma factor [Johnsonella sp.]
MDNHQITERVNKAKQSGEEADALITSYMPFIKSETSKFIKRMPMEGEDDELSIAMFAFYESILAYQPGKGAFLKLAALQIRNRLIDHYRKEKKHSMNLSLDQPASDGDEKGSILDKIEDSRDETEELLHLDASRKEIELFIKDLAAFGIELSEVADNQPRQDRTFFSCIEVLEYAKKNPEIIETMLASKKLPIAALSEGSKVGKKILERHRKYLIAALLAYTNGFELIRAHLDQIRRKER